MNGAHGSHTARCATRRAALRACLGTARSPAARAADTSPHGISTSANRPTAKPTAELLHDPGLFAEPVLTGVSKAHVPGQPPHGAAARRLLSHPRPQGLAIRARDTQHSRFPVARLPGLSRTAFTVTQDPGCGEFVALQSVAVGVTPSTSETLLGASDGPLQARYVHTLSRTSFEVNAATVCPAIAEPMLARASLETGPQATRASRPRRHHSLCTPNRRRLHASTRPSWRCSRSNRPCCDSCAAANARQRCRRRSPPTSKRSWRGLTDFTAMLDVVHGRSQIEQQWVEVRTKTSSRLVALNKALGGGCDAQGMSLVTSGRTH